MTRIIPRELIKHLEWNPGQELPKQVQEVPVRTLQSSQFSIDDILKGKIFYNESLPTALEQALEYAGNEGIVVNMPELIAAKAKADKSHAFWQNWLTALSEENVGIDKNGKLVTAGESVVVTVHGGGILTPERIRQAYNEGLTEQNAAKYTEEEFDNLLNGILPSGESINLYTVDDVREGKIADPFGRYAVALDFETAKSKSSGWHSKSDFMNNELVIARAGTLEHLDAYFEKAKQSDGTVGNWHRFEEIDYRQPQGRVLFVLNLYGGLYGFDLLDYDGRFVGVAAEPPKHKK